MPTAVSDVQLRLLDRPRQEPEFVRNLAAFTLGELYGDNTPSPVAIEEQVENTNTSTTAVAVDEHGSILATAAYIKMYDPHEAELVDVVTKSTERERGLGRKVVRAAEEAAREAGVTTMTVVPRDGSVTFYERLGYRRIADRSRFSRAL